MKRKWNWYAIASIIGLLMLIMDSKHALEGTRAGIELCIRTVIPSLFPFFVFSMLLTRTLGRNDFVLSRWISSVLKIPQVASSVLVPAFLGGYPVGAKCIGDLYHSRQIDKQNAERLLAFCSNAGPSFLFGMVSSFFPESKMIWLLWFIHIAGAVLTAFVFPEYASGRDAQRTEKHSDSSADIMLSALKAIGIVCGWVVLFRTVITFLQSWILWLCPQWLQVFLMGFLELSNGCCELMMVTDIRLRFILCSCMTAFGGLCVLMQTASVIKGLSIRNYIVGKIVQTFFCFLLSCAVITQRGWIFAAAIPVVLIILRKNKNRCGNPGTYPV